MRINIINPYYLTDQHLIAEINEINLLSQAFQRSYNIGIDKTRISNNYILNTGHVYFFYNKGKYLRKRYEQLKQEAINRGFNIRQQFKDNWKDKPEYDNDWKPEPQDYSIILERIINKIMLKSHWYRRHRKNIGDGILYVEMVKNEYNR